MQFIISFYVFILLVFQQKYEKNSNIKFFVVSFFIIREKSFNNMFFTERILKILNEAIGIIKKVTVPVNVKQPLKTYKRK